ncbi:porin [Candidatus Pelagibacter sp.]|uniref:porin n=1 Tax=Candidatus Pelagibacter sp. TaxID=2024849 RepID=UPI003F8351E1
MNKVTKVGLTALATSLVATASYAGELSVSGSASLTYTGLNSRSDTNPWAMGDSVKFSGSGDLDNGMTVSVYYELDGGYTQYDDYNLKLGMGDMGTLSFSGASSSGSGVDAAKDIVPKAYTPVYEAANEVGTTGVDNGLLDTSGNTQTGQWGYDVSAAGFDLSVSYNPVPAAAASAETGYSIKYNGLMDGLQLVYGMFDDGDIAENTTMGVKYTMGNMTAAIQTTDVDYESTSSTDQDATHMGISLAVNDDLTVSAGRQEVEFDGVGEDEVNTGVQASYTMGSISLTGALNSVESAGGTAGNDAEASIFVASFAF